MTAVTAITRLRRADWRFVCERTDELADISWGMTMGIGGIASFMALMQHANPAMFENLLVTVGMDPPNLYPFLRVWWQDLLGSAPIHFVLVLAMLLSHAIRAVHDLARDEKLHEEGVGLIQVRQRRERVILLAGLEGVDEEQSAPLPWGVISMVIVAFGAAHFNVGVYAASVFSIFTLALALVEFGRGLGETARQAWERRRTTRAA